VPTLSYAEALREAIREEMRADERVFIMGEDINAYGGSYTVTKGLLDEFGAKRCRDTPLAESVFVGAGVGAAMGGLRPIVELMTINFSLVAIDQIINGAAKVHYMFGGNFTAPLVIRTPAGWAQVGATHSQSFEAYFAHVPGLKVVMPSTPYDAKGLLKTAVRSDDPVMFIEHTKLYANKGEVPDAEYTIPFGKADIKRPGKHVTIVTYSRMVFIALQAAKALAEEGIEAEVIDLRSLRPLDIETIVESVRKTNRVMVLEEDWRSCGMGAEVASRIYEDAFDYLDAPIARLAAAEVPLPYAKNIEREAYPREEHVTRAARELLYRA
jgi:pyruvate dehydrogenase E1 component beta subunit